MDGHAREEGREHKHHTVGEIIEAIGLSPHLGHLVAFTWSIFIVCGWATTASAYLLDAAGAPDSDWVRRTSAEERLTHIDKSFMLLCAGIAAIFGNVIIGYTSDIWGRVLAIKFGLAVCCLSMVGFALARSKTALLVVFVCNPFGRDGLALVLQSLLAEWMPIYWRGYFLVSIHIAWNAGRFALTALWVVVPPEANWDQFITCVTMAPFAIFIFTVWYGWRFESPRWFAVKGDLHSAVEQLRLASRDAPAGLPDGWDHPDRVHLHGFSGRASGLERRSSRQQLGDMLSAEVWPLLWKLTAFFSILCFVTTGFFYWIMKFVQIRGDHNAVRFAMAAAPVSKMVCSGALIVGGPGRCLIDSVRRIPLMKAGFLGFSICLCWLCVAQGTLQIVVAVSLSQIFEELCWTASGVYVTEQLPTSVRNSCLGMVFMVSGIGGILGSALGGYLMKQWIFLHMLVMAALSLVGFAVCFPLPEDRDGAALIDVPLSTSSSGNKDSQGPGTASYGGLSYGAVGK